jgi:hypothetical protein
MRITLDIDEELMRALRARHPGASRGAAVEAAIADHLRRGAAGWLLAHAGRVEIEDVSAGLRAIDRHSWAQTAV